MAELLRFATGLVRNLCARLVPSVKDTGAGAQLQQFSLYAWQVPRAVPGTELSTCGVHSTVSQLDCLACLHLPKGCLHPIQHAAEPQQAGCLHVLSLGLTLDLSAEDASADADAGASDQEDAAQSSPQGPPADVQRRARASAASMLFVELLFWTPSKLSEDIREDYCWQVCTCVCSEAVRPISGLQSVLLVGCLRGRLALYLNGCWRVGQPCAFCLVRMGL